MALLALALLELAGFALLELEGIYWSFGDLELDSLGGPFTSRVSRAVGPSLSLGALLSFKRGTPLSDLALVCFLALLCTQCTAVPGSVKSDCFKFTLSTLPLQQAGWRGVLRQVRGCVHAAPLARTVASCRFRSRSHVQTGTLISSGLAHFSDTSFLWIVREVIASPVAIKCTRWTSSGNQRICQIPSCLWPSFNLSTDPIDTTLDHPKRICPCGVLDLATVRTVPSHRTQPCPGSGTWWRAQ